MFRFHTQSTDQSQLGSDGALNLNIVHYEGDLHKEVVVNTRIHGTPSVLHSQVESMCTDLGAAGEG